MWLILVWSDPLVLGFNEYQASIFLFEGTRLAHTMFKEYYVVEFF